MVRRRTLVLDAFSSMSVSRDTDTVGLGAALGRFADRGAAFALDLGVDTSSDDERDTAALAWW
jgi:hypothetical protein